MGTEPILPVLPSERKFPLTSLQFRTSSTTVPTGTQESIPESWDIKLGQISHITLIVMAKRCQESMYKSQST